MSFMPIISLSDANSYRLPMVHHCHIIAHSRHAHYNCVSAFRLAQNWQKALLAYEKAHAWQEVFTIATDKLEYDNTELESLAARIFGE